MTDNEQAGDVRQLRDITVEHMLGMAHGPLVKLEMGDGQGLVLRGKLPPADARRVAAHLMEAAARAEYEADLFATMIRDGWPKAHIGAILALVRDGEEARLTRKEEIGG